MNSVAVIFDNFGPYHLARLRAAAETCRLIAIEVASTSGTYAWARAQHDPGFERVTLFQDERSDSVSASELARRLRDALDASRPAVVFVPGWASAAAWAAMQWCLRRAIPMILMSESTAWDDPRSFWKETIKRRLVGCFSAALVGSPGHRDYLQKLGMDGAQVFLGYDAVDNAYFARSVNSAREKARARGNVGRPYLLACARFVPKKNLSRLLEAYALYRGRCRVEPWPLVLLGNGQQRGELERQRDSLALQECVLMPGFIQYAELPDYYAGAGAFVHASEIEPWGLVVNEAAASGLPLLVSRRCGCAPELVRPGENGFLFDPQNVEELAVQMEEVSKPDFPREQFGEASRRIVGQWDVGRFADGFARATAAAMSRKQATPATAKAVLSLLLLR